ncbi:chloride channel protein [Pantoea sp. Mb-10]|uniref:chloride channel protein n=1 Tax=unclassified Pantoea TaxID=2630326 RepID=UPI001E3AF546|nr:MULTISPECIES: chloride channel protein [unclassified Pantoea]MCE0490861.1 chloride channel protein [Pantoea sp. Mb-10]MCE0499981.1 chloride channel protein [Pantoea sp. Pb-8]
MKDWAGNVSYLIRLVAVVATGLAAGLAGMALGLILHAVQHYAFGYSLSHVIGTVSFLQGVSDSSFVRRIAAIVTGGVIAGFGWWLLGRYGQPRVSIKDAVAVPSRAMPPGTTTVHALLQIVTVALGSPLGREVAPREMGALAGGAIARRLGLNEDEVRILIACGAGAGLAAVYNVPLAGALFSLEVLLIAFSWEKAFAAVVTSALAAWIASLGLGNESQYHFLSVALPHTFVLWACLAGPLLGLAAWGFRIITGKARAGVKNNWQMPVICLLAFAVLAVLSLYHPQLPGNGKGPMQMAFSNELDDRHAAVLLGLKLLVILAVLRGGAEGGLLTPALAVGGLLSLLLCAGWQLIFPGGNAPSFALVGGAAFLAASMQMPLTAVVLVMEFTQMEHSYFVPVLLCAAGSYLTCRILDGKYRY